MNTDLLLEIREQITSHPGTHNQEEWGERSECGTTHCIAGWAAALSGAQLTWTDDTYGFSQLYHANGEDPGTYAARLMGLDTREAWQLFYKLNNADALAELDALIEKGKNDPHRCTICGEVQCVCGRWNNSA